MQAGHAPLNKAFVCMCVCVSVSNYLCFNVHVCVFWHVYSSYYNSENIAVCDVICLGDEDRLTDCDITTDTDYCYCSSGVVGITCSK